MCHCVQAIPVEVVIAFGDIGALHPGGDDQEEGGRHAQAEKELQVEPHPVSNGHPRSLSQHQS